MKLLLGKSVRLQRQILEQFKANTESNRIQMIHGSELQAAALVDACCGLSLFGGTTTVWVKTAEKIPRTEQEKLIPLLPNIPAETDLLFIANSIDRRLKFWQALTKIAKVISADPPENRNRRQWLQQNLQDRSLKVSREAFEVLAEIALHNFDELLILLEKIELYLDEASLVDISVIDSCSSGMARGSIFEWCDAMGAGDWPRALRLMRSLFDNEENPIALLGLLVRHYRILLRISENKALWSKQAQLAKLAGVPSFFLERYLKQARLFSPPSLKKIWLFFLNTDKDLKSSSAKKEWIMEKLLWDLKASHSFIKA